MMNTIEQPINLNELDKLAKLLASENITVQHSNASTAYFDTDKRLLMLPMWKNMSKTLYHMLTLHEVGHALYTDPVAWKAAILDTPKIKDILNVLEDARIERLVKDKYPGSRYDFRVGYKQLFDQNFFGLADKKVSALSLGDRINVHYKLGDHIAVPFSEVEQSIIAEIDALSTFNDVVTLAKRLLDNASKDNKAQASDQGKQASPSGEGEEASQADGEGDGDGEEASQSGDGEEASQSGEGEEAQQADGEGKQASQSGEGEEASQAGGEEASQSDTNGGLGNFDITTADSLTNNIADKMVNTAPTLATNYITLDTKIPLEEYIISYDRILANFAHPYVCDGVSGYSSFTKKNEQMVTLLASEFERKKAADTYSRTQEAKTGSLNFAKLHAYKLTTDLFRRNAITPSGKSHGLVMFVDFSASMIGNMKGTLEQLMGLVMFCRRVNIPHTVYGFKTYMDKDYAERSDRLNLNKVGRGPMLTPSAGMCLIELFSHRMTKTQFRDMTNILYDQLVSRVGNPHPVFQMCHTPLNSTALLAKPILAAFKASTQVQSLSAVFLTDGEVTDDYVMSGSQNNMIIQNPITKKNKKHVAGPSLTNTLIDMLRDDGYNTISYRIGSVRDLKYVMARNNSLTYVSGVRPIDVAKVTSSLKRGYAMLDDFNGFNQYYFLKSDKRELELDDDEFGFTVAPNATKAQITKSFIAAAQARTNIRPILTSFIDNIVSNKPRKNVSKSA